jgi:hypothetical protein
VAHTVALCTVRGRLRLVTARLQPAWHRALSDCRAVGEARQCRPLWAAQCGRRRCAYASSLPCADQNKQPFLFASPKQTLKPAPDLLAESCSRPFGQRSRCRCGDLQFQSNASAAQLPSALLAPFISCGDAVACNARVAQWTIPHPHRDGVATRNNSARLGMDQGLYLAVAGTDPSGSNTPSYTCSNGGRTVRHCCAAFRFGHSCRSDAHPAVEQSAPVCCPKSVGGACLTAAHRIRSDVLSTYSDRQAALL